MIRIINVVSDLFRYQDDAIEFAIDNDYPVVKIHRYFYDDNGKIRPDSDPVTIRSAVIEKTFDREQAIIDNMLKRDSK